MQHARCRNGKQRTDDRKKPAKCLLQQTICKSSKGASSKGWHLLLLFGIFAFYVAAIFLKAWIKALQKNPHALGLHKFTPEVV